MTYNTTTKPSDTAKREPVASSPATNQPVTPPKDPATPDVSKLAPNPMDKPAQPATKS